jgi:uncharacterized protein YdeI (YjbR/CyaY-like superfamily)
MNLLYCPNSSEWSEWLGQHFEREDEIWLVFYKKGTGIASIEYEAAVDEALCYGWIDSIIKKIDEQRYARKFTPRNDNSKWSESNKRRAEALIADQRMTEHGLAKIEAAKRNGRWYKDERTVIPQEFPAEFRKALEQNPAARKNFEDLSPTEQKRYTIWIALAKRPDTRLKRINESMALLEAGQKLGLK